MSYLFWHNYILVVTLITKCVGPFVFIISLLLSVFHLLFQGLDINLKHMVKYENYNFQLQYNLGYQEPD